MDGRTGLKRKPFLGRKCLALFLTVFCMLTLIVPSVALGEGGGWTSNGPYGGSVNSVTLSPNYATDHTLFAGAAGSGVYKSTDGGASWNPVNSGLSGNSLYVTSFALSPNYTADHTLFAGTGNGVYKSIDGGASWSSVSNGLTERGIRSIALSPNYPTDATLFATSSNLVFKSTDGGASWVNSGLSNQDSRQIAFSPNYAIDATVFAATGCGVYKSTNRGASWTKVDSRGAYSIALSPNYPTDATIFAGNYGGGVYKSTDGGTSWNWVNGGLTGSSLFINALAASPNYATDTTLFAGTYGGIFKSTDGGASWSLVNDGLANSYAYSIAISSSYATDATLFARTTNGVFKSTVGGANWTQSNNGLTATNVNSLAISPNYATDATLFAGTYNGIFRSTDRGKSWSSVLATYNVYSLAISPNYASDHTIFAGTGSGACKSTDGGSTWALIGSGRLYSRVYSLAISPNYATDATLFAMTEDGVYKSTDGGANWTQSRWFYRSGSIFNSSLSISPNYANDGTVFFGVDSLYEYGVYKSTNGGASWGSVGLGGYASVVFSPNYATDATLFAGTGGGVYKSTNRGAGWAKISSGLTRLNTVALSPNFATDATLFAGARDGVYKSIDGGASWVSMSDGLTGTNVLSLAISPNFATDAALFAGTYGGGVNNYASDTVPPTTTLSTNPIIPDGANGWFISPTTVTLSSDEPGATYFQWDTDSGPWTACAGALSVPEGEHTLYYYSVDQAGNKEASHSQAFKLDLTAPVIAAPGDVTLEATGSDGAVANFEATASDNLSSASISYSKNPGTVFPLGTTTVTVTAIDGAGNTATKSFTVTVRYSRSGFLRPIDDSPNGVSVVKAGSTLPVKFTLTDASAGIADGAFSIFITDLDANGGPVETAAISASKASTGNHFRYDETSGQYIFNLSTKGFVSGHTYRIRVDLGDGSVNTAEFLVK